MSAPLSTAAQERLENCCLVLDIGKTNVKLHVLSATSESVFSTSRSNNVINEDLYPHADVKGIWIWMKSALLELTDKYHISSISITTHGATAALINRNAVDDEDGLVMPVLDYEFAGIEELNSEYEKARPDFARTYSPSLPAGLNLGRQLFWQQRTFPEAFAKATDILCYPQYWAWHLTGALCSEVTSLGCHTDLWYPDDKNYSSLVDGQGWSKLFPEIKPAWDTVGVISEKVSTQTGLDAGCKVYVGVHDSNASFLRYKLKQSSKPFTVISTGTWTILMASGVFTDNLDPAKDMLANVDVTNTPVACARFMGGREFEGICKTLGGRFGDSFDASLLQSLIDQDVFALPDFSDGSGPFGGRKSEFVNRDADVMKAAGSGAALATLYCALMMDYQLDKLQSVGDIFIEGAFLQNPLMCGLLSQLRDEQLVWLSADATGTVQGCASLTHWEDEHKNFDLEKPPVVSLKNIQAYKKAWLAQLEG